VEGDYMVEGKTDISSTTYISPESETGFRLQVVDHTIIIIGPNRSNRSFTFNNKEDWENFLEALWKTQHYMAVRKKDFIEFFQALRHLHGHHCRQMDVVTARQLNIQEEIKQQQEDLSKLKEILNHYEEYYTEAYEEVRNENKV
jgi:DNA mismatch repair ATPase MutS